MTRDTKKLISTLVLLLVVLLSILMPLSSAASLYNRRRLRENKAWKGPGMKHCPPKARCGWVVYGEQGLQVYYNTCSCSTGFRCRKDEFDPSRRAVVYRCKPLSNLRKR